MVRPDLFFREMMMNEKAIEKEFSRKMTDILNFGALNLAMSIGYQTGLFDVMDELDTPRTTSVIADRAGLDERYVKEWLCVMVSGGIVALSHGPEGDDLFFLPKAHGDVVTRRAGHSNLGVYTQEIPLLTTCALGPVLRGFQTGEGVSYDHYPRFQDFMAQLANAKHRDVLVDLFLPSVQDGFLIRRLKSGIRVCDLGCAEGIAVMLMAEAFPNSEFVGIDLSDEAIEKAKTESRRRSLSNLTFVRQDAASMKNDPDLVGSFDYVTAFDAVHDQTRPLDALISVHGILKSGGLFSMVDIAASSHLVDNKDHPMGSFLYTVSLMHCMPVGLVDGGTGLGMMWGRQKAVEMLKQAGFSDVQVLEIPEDPFNLHFLAQKQKRGKSK
jgi:ubiquinone/menaquinone biosynthesis C-methylase UbiE